MKSPLFTFAVCMLLAQMISGAWYAKKCANKTGTCRKMCRDGEMETDPVTGICPKKKLCCILSSKDQSIYPPFCGETSSTTSVPPAKPGASSAKTTVAGGNKVTETTAAGGNKVTGTTAAGRNKVTETTAAGGNEVTETTAAG